MNEGATEDRVHLTIGDTSIGTSDEFLAELFKELRQEPARLDRRPREAGLGRVTTKGSVNLRGGEVEAKSTKGGGAFAVPSGREKTPRHRATSDEPRPGAPADQRGRLLVVEDNRDTMRLLSHVLSDEWAISEARYPEEALDVAEGQSFDVLLIDINLGGKTDGVDLLRDLRKREAYRDVPVLALTAYAMPSDRERFLRIGFDAYLSKPFVTKELRRLLRSMY